MMIDSKLEKDLGTKTGGNSITQETVCINGKCKSKMEKCAGNNCKVAYNNNVNMNNVKSLGLHNQGFRKGFSSSFISDFLNWNPFNSMSGLFANLFGEQRSNSQKRMHKETTAQFNRRLGQSI